MPIAIAWHRGHGFRWSVAIIVAVAVPRFPADWNAYAQQEREGFDEMVNVVTAWTGVPHPSSEPHEITVAADGTVWVALETGSVVSPVPQEFTPQPPSTSTNSKRPHGGNTRIRD